MNQDQELKQQWKTFADHLLNQYLWSDAAKNQALQFIERYIGFLPDEKNASQFIQHLIDALSRTAAPPMAVQNFERYLEAFADPGEELMRCIYDTEHLNFLTSLCATSTLFSDILAANPIFLSWIMKEGNLSQEKSLNEYMEELFEFVDHETELEKRREKLCLYKRRELLRLGIRDQLDYGNIEEYCHELTSLAEAACKLAYCDCMVKVVSEYGMPIRETAPDDSNGEVKFCVIAMGKFGGNELNFSSDIDLNFVYDEEGMTTGVLSSIGHLKNKVTSQQFYCNLAFEIANYLGQSTTEGMIYRVDTRLRPEGNAGQVARSFVSYSTFFFTQTLAWEKVAYIKARAVAGDDLLAERFHTLVESFIYTNNDPNVLLPEVARLKKRIDFERLSNEGRRLDLKRGRGGIREIEFIISSYQLLLSEKYPELRTRSSMKAARILREKKVINEKDELLLRDAYWFFRGVEHQLQMVEEKQTHELPDDEQEMQRLSVRFGFRDTERFLSLLNTYRDGVRTFFGEVFNVPEDDLAGLSLLDVLENREAADEKAFVHLKPFRMDSPEGVRALRELALGTNELAISGKGQKAFTDLLPILLGELKTAADPVNAINHLTHFLKSHRGISAFYQLMIAHPPLVRLLIRSMGFSPMIARNLAAHPDWFDEILEGDILAVERSRPTLMLKGTELEPNLKRIRIFRSRETVYNAVREVLGIEKSINAAKVTTLTAEECFEKVMELVMPDHLRPHLVILGLGTLGNMKVHPFGDLDIAFVTELKKADFSEFDKLEQAARKILKVMTEHSPDGQIWKVDCRLRPDGISSPLVTDQKRIRSYYMESAGFWEFQSAIRMRAVAGELSIGYQTIQEIQEVYLERESSFDARKEILTMRKRLDDDFKLPRHNQYDLKRSAGGILDVDFLAQYLVLTNFRNHPDLWQHSTMNILKRSGELGFLNETDCEFLMSHFYNLRLFQRAVRFHLETSKDGIPDKEKTRKALSVAMAAQVDEPEKMMREMPQKMMKTRVLFERLLK